LLLLKNHIGFYPTPTGIEAFRKELSVYEGAKGSVKFPIDKPLPFDLVTKIVNSGLKKTWKKGRKKSSIGLKKYTIIINLELSF